ncbi:MAG: hypothetical protein WCT10_00490 [Patescibacteria group bacterium]|jgi:hypothetical protein
MFLIAHAAIGAAVAPLTGSPLPAFFLGWLTHYLADAVPHGDESLGRWATARDGIRRFVFLAGVDFLLVAAILAIVFVARGFDWTILAGAVGATVPDFMWGLEKTFQRRLFGPFQDWHGLAHGIIKKKIPTAAGLALQFLVAAASWFWVAGAGR